MERDGQATGPGDSPGRHILGAPQLRRATLNPLSPWLPIRFSLLSFSLPFPWEFLFSSICFVAFFFFPILSLVCHYCRCSEKAQLKGTKCSRTPLRPPPGSHAFSFFLFLPLSLQTETGAAPTMDSPANACRIRESALHQGD